MFDEYPDFLHTLQSHFMTTAAAGALRLFETDAKDLFDLYLANLPAEVRQQYNCSCCRAFVKRFGGLVTVTETGDQIPVMWEGLDGTAPELHRNAIYALSSAVARARVKGPFLSEDRVWGKPEAGGFTHMHVTPPASLVYQRGDVSARQAMAVKREEMVMTTRALIEFDAAVVREALRILSAGLVYRSERFLSAVQFLSDAQAIQTQGRSSTHTRNMLWRHLSLAPAGFARIRKSAVGTMLEGIKKGLPFADVKRMFEAKVSADRYQVATTAPAAQTIARAEQIFADLGLAPALQRRYAQVNELPLQWAPSTSPAAKAIHLNSAPAGVFAGVKSRSAAPAEIDPLTLPAVRMTWAKFQASVMPAARIIEALVPRTTERFAALVTAVDPAAPNLLQWDSPMSWYYEAGIDSEIRRRVTEAGGMVENVAVRVSLIWNNRNDLDLEVMAPDGQKINFMNKRVAGGTLDVDRNINGETNKPVENIRWPSSDLRPGTYRVSLWNYSNHVQPIADTPFSVEVEVGGRAFLYSGVVSRSQALRQPIPVLRFSVDAQGNFVQDPEASGHVRVAEASAGGQNSWSLAPGSFVPVRGVVTSPNTWGEARAAHLGAHTFFLLEGCQDTLKGRGKMLIPETLRGDLHDVRSVIQAFAATAELTLVQNAAAGLGMVAGRDWNLHLRVTTDLGQQVYLIDRHE